MGEVILGIALEVDPDLLTKAAARALCPVDPNFSFWADKVSATEWLAMTFTCRYGATPRTVWGPRGKA